MRRIGCARRGRTTNPVRLAWATLLSLSISFSLSRFLFFFSRQWYLLYRAAAQTTSAASATRYRGGEGRCGTLRRRQVCLRCSEVERRSLGTAATQRKTRVSYSTGVLMPVQPVLRLLLPLLLLLLLLGLRLRFTWPSREKSGCAPDSGSMMDKRSCPMPCRRFSDTVTISYPDQSGPRWRSLRCWDVGRVAHVERQGSWEKAGACADAGENVGAQQQNDMIWSPKRREPGQHPQT